MKTSGLTSLEVVVVLMVPCLVALVAFSFLWKNLFQPVSPGNEAVISVEIAPGENFSSIIKKIKGKGISRNEWSLKIIGKIQKIDTKIKSGEYAFKASMTPKEIIKTLASGKVIERIVAVIPGMSIKDVARVVGESGLLDEEKVLNGLFSRELLDKWGISAESFEGYLYPDTYKFSRPVTIEDIIRPMLLGAEKKWATDYTEKAQELMMDRHQILTLASIIQKESSLPDELPLVSSVFHNRLKRGMKLQADPTVIYGMKNYNGNLTKEDLETPTPYNTYVNPGLPPGPICNPDENAIRAALYPSFSSYLYFVADGSGGHKFSTTLQDHNLSVLNFLRPPSESNSADQKQGATLP